MRNIICILALVLSIQSFAAFPKVQVKEFSGLFQNGLGKAQASSFVFEEYDFGDKPKFDVEMKGNGLYLKSGDKEFEFQNLPEMIYDVKGMRWSGIHIDSSASKADIKLGSFIGQYLETVVRAKDLRLACEGNKDYLETCFNQKGHLSFSEIETITNGGKTNIGNFSFSTNKGSMNFTIQASAKVKGKGIVSYKDDTITIKVTEAKSGMFSVVGRLFDELEAMESESIKVQRPYLIIKL